MRRARRTDGAGSPAARLELGFPTREGFAGTDPRGDPAIRAALKAAGKLK